MLTYNFMIYLLFYYFKYSYLIVKHFGLNSNYIWVMFKRIYYNKPLKIYIWYWLYILKIKANVITEIEVNVQNRL